MTPPGRFIQGALYRTKTEVPIFGAEIEKLEFVPIEDFLVFLSDAGPKSIADSWYWPKKNKIIKIIMTSALIDEHFDLVEIPSCNPETP
jgi:hypothetical protein